MIDLTCYRCGSQPCTCADGITLYHGDQPGKEGVLPGRQTEHGHDDVPAGCAGKTKDVPERTYLRKESNMTQEDLKKTLEQHELWLAENGGKRANLCDADLRGADLRNANLRDANLRGADLCGADLRNANLCDADLRGADLRNANLRDADLRGADLRNADLRGADLRDADLCGADLRGADLRDAILCDANFDQAKIIYRGQTVVIRFVKETKEEAKATNAA